MSEDSEKKVVASRLGNESRIKSTTKLVVSLSLVLLLYCLESKGTQNQLKTELQRFQELERELSGRESGGIPYSYCSFSFPLLLALQSQANAGMVQQAQVQGTHPSKRSQHPEKMQMSSISYFSCVPCLPPNSDSVMGST